MELSVNTDFMKSVGNVRKPLSLISEAGFSYIHWCHHWFDDYMYSDREVRKIQGLLDEYNLKLFDLHASMGIRKRYNGAKEKVREKGENLLRNRIKMTHALGGRAVVLHTNTGVLSPRTKERTEHGIKTLKNLEPMCKDLGVRIAVENLFDNGGDSSFYDIQKFFETFESSYVGLCWDTGHSNIVSQGVDRVAPFVQERLLVLHLNGNMAQKDDHMPIGDGTQDWDTIAEMVAKSPYDGVLTQEVVKTKGMDPADFLSKVYQRGEAFAKQIEQLRQL